MAPRSSESEPSFRGGRQYQPCFAERVFEFAEQPARIVIWPRPGRHRPLRLPLIRPRTAVGLLAKLEAINFLEPFGL